MPDTEPFLSISILAGYDVNEGSLCDHILWNLGSPGRKPMLPRATSVEAAAAVRLTSDCGASCTRTVCSTKTRTIALPAGTSLGRSKTKRAPCLGWCRRPAAMPLEQARCDAHEFVVAGREPVPTRPNVVLHTGTHGIRSARQRPLHHLRLMATDAGRRPCRTGNDASGLRKQNVEQMLYRRKGVLNPHNKLDVRFCDIKPASINRLAP